VVVIASSQSSSHKSWQPAAIEGTKHAPTPISLHSGASVLSAHFVVVVVDVIVDVDVDVDVVVDVVVTDEVGHASQVAGHPLATVGR